VKAILKEPTVDIELRIRIREFQIAEQSNNNFSYLICKNLTKIK